MCESHLLERESGSWQLANDVDAFGNRLETELGSVFTDVSSITAATNSLNQHFQPDGDYGTPSPEHDGMAEYIPDITDFSQIICFATAGGGEQFCFDYRKTGTSPCVIYWDEIYWRRIAPDFKTFVTLFDLASSG